MQIERTLVHSKDSLNIIIGAFHIYKDKLGAFHDKLSEKTPTDL